MSRDFWLIVAGYIAGIVTFGCVLLYVGWGLRRGKWRSNTEHAEERDALGWHTDEAGGHSADGVWLTRNEALQVRDTIRAAYNGSPWRKHLLALLDSRLGAEHAKGKP